MTDEERREAISTFAHSLGDNLVLHFVGIGFWTKQPLFMGQPWIEIVSRINLPPMGTNIAMATCERVQLKRYEVGFDEESGCWPRTSWWGYAKDKRDMWTMMQMFMQYCRETRHHA